MKKDNKVKNGLKVAGAVAVGAGLVLAGGLAGIAMFPKEVEVPVPVPVIKEKIVNNTIEVPVEKIVEVEKEVFVEVDNGNLDLVLEHIYDNDGKVEYLLDDLDEDEIEQIVDRIVFVNDIKQMAVSHVQKELADELDRVLVGTVELDEDDIEKIRIDDDDDEIIVDDVDFEDLDAELTVTGKFRHDDVWYVFESTVEIEDGDIENFEINSVVEE